MRPLTFLFAAALAQAAFTQDRFPAMQGERADGSSVDLPGRPSTPFIVIGLACSQKAQPALEAWYEPAYLRFVAKHGLFASAYSTEVYFVPLFTGANKAAYAPSLKKFRKSAEPEVADRVVFVKEDADEIRQALGLKNKDIPYFFVVDREGRIVHRAQGDFSDEKLEAIEEVLLR
ncbi:MAG TPA: hypothetical protein PKY96_17450 [Flavobacteriales bacterium]|nr:hypothetical protein [Flavobacteriales bacterium]